MLVLVSGTVWVVVPDRTELLVCARLSVQNKHIGDNVLNNECRLDYFTRPLRAREHREVDLAAAWR